MGLKKSVFFALLLLMLTSLSSVMVYGLEYKPDLSNPRATDLPLETKRSMRQTMLAGLLVKYSDNHTFPKMYEYMVSKYNQLHKTGTPRYPNLIIQETLEKSRSLFEKVKPFVGNSFKRKFQPEEIEKSINKYMWLRGICFLFLGIRDEHKIALSYFYLPGNEELKYQFLRDTVKFSYPEVYDVPENSAWFDSMTLVMERIGYKLFNVNKYCPEAVLTPEKLPLIRAAAEKEKQAAEKAEAEKAEEAPLPSPQAE